MQKLISFCGSDQLCRHENGQGKICKKHREGIEIGLNTLTHNGEKLRKASGDAEKYHGKSGKGVGVGAGKQILTQQDLRLIQKEDQRGNDE